ncbi:transketolase family protein [Methylocystis sp. JAN1]|uniref:transketolase family protein n=1 Tax=Methylocystis sp. JAN1 TaxID=3397211 RepID=UPI003FA25D80
MRNRIIRLIEADAALDDKVAFLTGDLGFSVVEPLQEALGERFINVGVAEANLASIAGSLAALDFRPFIYSIGPFITSRCFEQIRNDIVYQRRKAGVIGVGAGFSYGSLGPSHHALEDATIMASLPGMLVGNPGNVAELERFYALAQAVDGPAYFRIARESGVDFPVPIFSLETSAYSVRAGDDATLVACGVSVTECLAAADLLAERGVEARVVSAPVIAPFPTAALARTIAKRGPVVSVFEGFPGNPFSVGVMRTLYEHRFDNAYAELTTPHRFEHVVGDTQALRAACGLDAASIAERTLALAAGAAPRRRVEASR